MHFNVPIILTSLSQSLTFLSRSHLSHLAAPVPTLTYIEDGKGAEIYRLVCAISSNKIYHHISQGSPIPDKGSVFEVNGEGFKAIFNQHPILGRLKGKI